MVCSITVRFAEPAGDNEELTEALAIVRAKPLTNLKRQQHWLANPPAFFPTPQAVYAFLMKHAKGDDYIEVSNLTATPLSGKVTPLAEAG